MEYYLTINKTITYWNLHISEPQLWWGRAVRSLSALGATFPATAPHSPPLSGMPVSGSLSAVVMKQLKMLTGQSLSSLAASGPLTLLIPRHNFQRSAISGTLTQQANFLGAGAATVGVAGIRDFGSLIIGYARNSSWCNSSSSMPFWEAMGLLLLVTVFSIFFVSAKESSLSPVSNLTCITFPTRPQWVGGKGLGSGV